MREGKGITLTKNIKGRIASAVKTGNGALNLKTNIGRVYISDDVNFYLFRYMQDSGDIVVIDILSEKLHKNTIDIIEEALKNGNQGERNNSNVSEWIESFWIRQGNNSIYSGSNASSYGTNGGTNALYGNSSNSKSLRNREAGVGLDNNSNQLTSHLPVKQKFVDISGRHRNVLGIGDGIYAQDVKTIEKEIKEYGRSGRIKSVQRSTYFIDTLNQPGGPDSGGGSNFDGDIIGHGAKNNQIQQLGKVETNRGERTGRDGGGNNQGSGNDRQGQDVDKRVPCRADGAGKTGCRQAARE